MAIRNLMIAKTWKWMQIWLAIKPNLKCTQFGKYKKEYEDKIALAEANIDKAFADREKVQAVHDGLLGQKNELSLALQSGGSAVQEIIDKTIRIENMSAEVKKEAEDVQKRIKAEKEQKNALDQQMAKTNAAVAQLEQEVSNLENALSTGEQDRANKDDQIRTLNDEVAHQSEMIAKLGKEKRSCGDSKQKTEEDIQAAEDKCNHLSRVKGKLEQALDEAEDSLEREKKVKGDAEAKDRASLLTKFKSMSTELANLKEKIENENIRKSDAMKALSKAAAEIQLWRSRFETEGMGRIEEPETGRSKLQSRIVEAEETVDSLQTKIANVEKARARLTTELEEMAMDFERVHAATLIAEKRSKNFEKIQGEWQSKANDIVMEMEASQNEGRNYSSELFRLKAAHDEVTEQLDIVKRENKNLADEIKDLLDQLGDGGRSIHDLDKQRRRLEQEKEELQV